MRVLVNILILAVSIYLVLALALYLFQGKMVFLSNFPARALSASPIDIGLEYENVALTTSDDEQLHGWYVQAMDARGVVLFFHVKAGNNYHRLDSIRIFQELELV